MRSGGRRGVAIGRGRASALLLLALSVVASAGGYWFLGGQIAAGERRFAAGQRRLMDGEPALAQGKDELEAGKRRLSDGKDEYREAESSRFLVWADRLFQGGRGFKKAKERIDEGERKVADGEEMVSEGERQVDAGREKLLLGRERLRLARAARVACAVGAFLFLAVLMMAVRPAGPLPAE